jgi:hypothetical protein
LFENHRATLSLVFRMETQVLLLKPSMNTLQADITHALSCTIETGYSVLPVYC